MNASLMVPAAAILIISASGVGAQNRTFSLESLQDSARANDPRARQLSLLARQSELRRRNIAGELLPSIALESQAQYQSDVPRVPVPGAPTLPHDTYDARVVLNQRVIDPSIDARRDVERAQLAHSQAAVEASLYGTRARVNDAYFGVLRAQVQADELRADLSAIESQVTVAAARVREGAALQSEELVLRAELLRRRQLLAEAEITRGAALVTLASITGVAVDSATRLTLPDYTSEISRAREIVAALQARGRPEYEQFETSRALLREQERARAAQDRPRAFAFGRAGYGQPGLNPLNDSFDSYWLAGIQIQWSPWTWGTGRRDREVLAAQREIVTSEETAFTEQLHRAAVLDLAAVERLEASVRLDDEIIAVRETIAAETRARFTEGVVTSAEFVERQSQLLGARLGRALHRAALAHARARLLNTLGIEIEP